jgi:predicted MFS family arabinose efflux permease
LSSGSGPFLASRRGRIFRALRYRAFRRLYSALLLSQLGFWVSHISLQYVTERLSGSSPEALGLLLMLLHLPQLFLAPLTGVAADRWNRRAILVSGYAALAGLIGVLAVMVARDSARLELLYLVSLGIGLSNAWIGPANHAAVADTVPARDLPSAIALGSMAMNLTRVAGPLVAGAILLASGPATSFALFAVSLLAVIALLFRVRLRAIQRDAGEEGVLARLRTGLRHARERHPALPVLITVAVMSVFGVSHVALHAVFASTTLGDLDYFPYLGAASGVGAIAGALAIGLRSQPLTLASCGSHVAGFGAALVGFGLCRHVLPALLAQLVVGFFYFSAMTMMQTLVMQSIDDAKRGRVMSLFSVGWGGLITLGAPLMGLAARRAGTPETILMGGAVCLAFGAYRWLGGGARSPAPAGYTAPPPGK